MSSFLFMRKYLSLRHKVINMGAIKNRLPIMLVLFFAVMNLAAGKDKLQNELEFINKNLEAMVNERTPGLKLCYELVQINKGTMSVESKEEKDLVFQ